MDPADYSVEHYSDGHQDNVSGNDATIDQILLNAEALYNDDKLLQAARILRPLFEQHQTSSFAKVHRDIFEKAQDCEKFITEIKSRRNEENDAELSGDQGNDNGHFGRWMKQSTTKCRDRRTDIHYMLDEETQSQLSLRVDTPIEKSLFIPLLSVLNESELYTTWLPSWSLPRMGVRACDKLCQTGRVSQVTALTIDLPWPLQTREAIISAIGVDDIAELGEIVVRIKCIDDDGLVRPHEMAKEKNEVVRVDFEGGFVFRKCESTGGCNDVEGLYNDESEAENEEDLIMVSYQSKTDAKLSHIPESLLNFVLRNAVEMTWDNLLHVAEEVRDGARPLHAGKILDKHEVLYGWLEKRVDAMLA